MALVWGRNGKRPLSWAVWTSKERDDLRRRAEVNESRVAIVQPMYKCMRDLRVLHYGLPAVSLC
jgi:hypothetical protein